MTRTRKGPLLHLGTEYLDGSAPSLCTLQDVSSDTISVGDTGRYGYPRFPLNRNVGGALYSTRLRASYGTIDVGEVWRGGALHQHYVGEMCAKYNAPGSVSTADGSSRSAEAYNKMKPTKPLLNTLNSIYELREVPEMLRQEFLKRGLKGIPSYWLALQFGWKPLLQDIRNLVLSQRKMQERLNWLIKHNGRPVRRSVVLSETSQVTFEQSQVMFGGSFLNPGLVTQYFRKNGRQHLVNSSGERWWANGRFRFWLPEGPRDIAWRRSMLNRLYGLHPSPSVIYNAIPWTWLADWFSTAGDVVSNLDAGVADRCAADYCYMMRHNWAKSEQHVAFYMRRKDGSPADFSSTTTSIREVKTRIEGNPFGFSIKDANLSSMQLSILGALGLSRL